MAEKVFCDEPSNGHHPADCPAAEVACLKAAKRYGLIRKESRLCCPTSALQDIGWWARSAYADWAADPAQGGPWTVERVQSLCERGLLGIDNDKHNRALLTKAGAKALKPAAGQSAEANSTGRLDTPNPAKAPS